MATNPTTTTNDKKVFLFDKWSYGKELVNRLTEKDIEEWVMNKEYEEKCTAFKINANPYKTAEEAISKEMPFLDTREYHVRAFGFN